MTEDAYEYRKTNGSKFLWKISDYTNCTTTIYLRLTISDFTLISPLQCGTLRFCGAAQFAPGVWAGVELEDAVGKNNGTLNGVQYFTCADNHGKHLPTSEPISPSQRCTLDITDYFQVPTYLQRKYFSSRYSGLPILFRPSHEVRTPSVVSLTAHIHFNLEMLGTHKN